MTLYPFSAIFSRYGDGTNFSSGGLGLVYRQLDRPSPGPVDLNNAT
jgi:hypothetical protein